MPNVRRHVAAQLAHDVILYVDASMDTEPAMVHSTARISCYFLLGDFRFCLHEANILQRHQEA